MLAKCPRTRTSFTFLNIHGAVDRHGVLPVADRKARIILEYLSKYACNMLINMNMFFMAWQLRKQRHIADLRNPGVPWFPANRMQAWSVYVQGRRAGGPLARPSAQPAATLRQSAMSAKRDSLAV